MKKLDELTSADFPGYPPDKIDEWLAAARETNRNYLMYMGGLLLVFIIISLAIQRIALPGLLLLIVGPIFINRKVRKLEKELHITRSIFMKARRGELVAQAGQSQAPIPPAGA